MHLVELFKLIDIEAVIQIILPTRIVHTSQFLLRNFIRNFLALSLYKTSRATFMTALSHCFGNYTVIF